MPGRAGVVYCACLSIMRRRGGREAEGGGLLIRYRGNTSIQGSNPCLSAMRRKGERLGKVMRLQEEETHLEGGPPGRGAPRPPMSARVAGRSVLIVGCVVLLWAALSGCWGEPIWYDTVTSSKIFFLTTDSLSGDSVCELSCPHVAVSLRGFFFLTSTEGGQRHDLSLVVRCEEMAESTRLTFHPDSITAKYKDVPLEAVTSQVVERGSNGSRVQFDVYLWHSDGGATLSSIEYSRDFCEPHLEIDLSRFVRFDGTYCPFPRVLAFPRDPARCK